MTTFSTVPAVKEGVVAALAAAFGTATQVTYGHPGSAPGIRQAAYVGGLAQWSKEWALLGTQQTDETYTLELTLVASFPSASDFRQPTEAVFAMADIARTTLQGLSTVNGAALVLPVLVVPGPTGFAEFFTDDKGTGRASLIELGAQVRARLA